MNGRWLQKKIRQIQQEIADLGPLRPGALYQRGNVCGKAGCRWKRKKNPVPHGPYYYLSYTLKGKSHTKHVSARDLPVVREQIRNYKTLTERIRRQSRNQMWSHAEAQSTRRKGPHSLRPPRLCVRLFGRGLDENCSRKQET